MWIVADPPRYIDALQRSPTNGLRPANIAFVPGMQQAYVTKVLNLTVELIDMPWVGLPLHRPRVPLDLQGVT